MRSQANTAKLLADNPTLMLLRELEVLETVAANSKFNILLGDKGLADRVMNVSTLRQDGGMFQNAAGYLFGHDIFSLPVAPCSVLNELLTAADRHVSRSGLPKMERVLKGQTVVINRVLPRPRPLGRRRLHGRLKDSDRGIKTLRPRTMEPAGAAGCLLTAARTKLPTKRLWLSLQVIGHVLADRATATRP
jgi:hypothetical protein